jgi:hypothetical protein
MPAYKGTKQIRPGKLPPTPSQSKEALQAALDAVEQRKRLGITRTTVDFRPTPTKKGTK